MTDVSLSIARSDVRERWKECSASSGCVGESLTRAEQDVDWGRSFGSDSDEAQPCRQVSHLVAGLVGEATSLGSTQGRF